MVKKSPPRRTQSFKTASNSYSIGMIQIFLIIVVYHFFWMQGLKKHFVLVLLSVVLLPGASFAQNLTKIMGTVIDAATKDPIPFVNVYFPNSDVATTTDFDGKFAIETKNPKDSLYAQYMGYIKQSKRVVKNKFQNVDFELKPLSYELKEVEILPGLNPAATVDTVMPATSAAPSSSNMPSPTSLP